MDTVVRTHPDPTPHDVRARLRLKSFRSGWDLVPGIPVAPMAYQVILEPGIVFVGTFSCGQIDLRKARERELATLDEKSTSSGIAEPYAQ